jgi:hypothetical protein
MRAAGKNLVSGLACLAALLTPLSGVPHIVCRCPDGHVKPFCLGITVPKSGGCCCRGSCCSRNRGGKCCGCCRTHGATCDRRGTRAPCCGSPQVPSGAKALAGGSGAADASCCVKTLQRTVSLAIVPVKETPGKDTRHLADLAEAAATAGVPAGISVFRVPGLAHSPGPPADLPTLLRRLVI